MKKSILLLSILLISKLGFAQIQPIKIEIDSVTFVDNSTSKRTYNINYHIKNNTNNEISFFLNPKSLIAFEASSMTLFAVYKMYKNGVYEKMDGPFYELFFDELAIYENNDDRKSNDNLEKIKTFFENKKRELQLKIDNFKKTDPTKTDDWIFNHLNLLQSKIVLKPNESKKYTIITSWNRNRHFKIGDYEYYLDEKDRFEIELNLILNKSNRSEFLPESDFNYIKTNPNFIEGVFISNKKELFFN